MKLIDLDIDNLSSHQLKKLHVVTEDYLFYLESVEKLSKKVLPVMERIIAGEKATNEFIDLLRKK